MTIEGARSFQTPDAYNRGVGRYSPELARRLVALSGIRHGQRALDIGCGTGILTAELASILGAENVSGVDPSEPFLSACRARVPGADIREGSAEHLPFDDNNFDAVLAQLVINYMSDVHGGLREMRRVARPGAVVAGCVWDYASGMTMLRAFWDAAVECRSPDAASLDQGVATKYATPDELTDLWEGAGLKDVQTGPLDVGADYESFEDLWAPFEAGVGPSGSYYMSLSYDLRECIRQQVFRRLGSPRSPFHLTARAWCVRGLV